MTPRHCPPSHPVAPLPDPDQEFARLAAALGHPVRIRILRFLLEQEECFAGAIVEHLPLAQSTVSQHLKVLREAGLVRGEVEGPRVSYCANVEALTRAEGLLAGIRGGSREGPGACRQEETGFAGAPHV